MLGNSLYSGASQWQDLGRKCSSGTVSAEWKLPMAGHDHQQRPLFRLRTNSLPAAHTWLESPRRKSGSSIWAEQEWARPLLNSSPYVTLEPSLEDNVSTICGHGRDPCAQTHKVTFTYEWPDRYILQALPHGTPPPTSVASEWNGCSQSLALNLSPKFKSSRKKDWMKFFYSRETQAAFLKSLPSTRRHLFRASPRLGILWIAVKCWCFTAVKTQEFLPGSESGDEHTHNRDQKIQAAYNPPSRLRLTLCP